MVAAELSRTREQAVSHANMNDAVLMWQRAWESNPVAPFLTRAALAMRWLPVRLALFEVIRPHNGAWRALKLATFSQWAGRARPCAGRCGAGAVIRTLYARFGVWLLSQEHPGLKMAEGGGIEPHWLITSPPFSKRLGGHSPAPSITQRTWCPRRELNSHSRRNWFLRPARMHFATRALEHRSGLEPDKDGFAARRLGHFGIQCLF